MQKAITVKRPLSPNLSEVQNIIAEITGYEPTDIQPSFSLTEDLQLNMEVDFPLIVKRVNSHFGTHLKHKELLDELDSVGELVELIDEETELG